MPTAVLVESARFIIPEFRWDRNSLFSAAMWTPFGCDMGWAPIDFCFFKTGYQLRTPIRSMLTMRRVFFLILFSFSSRSLPPHPMYFLHRRPQIRVCVFIRGKWPAENGPPNFDGRCGRV
jgi:hypothetical protein